MEQFVIAMIIIALGIYVFKFYPFEKGNVMKLVIAAIFIILTAICKRLAIMIPLFGSESLKIGFEYIPLMLAGYFLSPSYAFLVGLCSDVIGLIIVPTGFPFFGFTLGTILVSVIPSMVHEHSKNISPTRILMIVIGLIAVLAIGAIVYIGQLDVINISETTYHLKSQDKITLISLCVLLSLVFTTIIIFLKRKINEQEAKTFSTWILCVVLVELVVTLCLTPLWLDMMYHIPWTISFCIRVVKECAVLPIEIFIGYSLIPLLRRIWIRLER